MSQSLSWAHTRRTTTTASPEKTSLANFSYHYPLLWCMYTDTWNRARIMKVSFEPAWLDTLRRRTSFCPSLHTLSIYTTGYRQISPLLDKALQHRNATGHRISHIVIARLQPVLNTFPVISVERKESIRSHVDSLEITTAASWPKTSLAKIANTERTVIDWPDI